MPAPRKYDDETRARAVRMYQDRLRDGGESKLEARRRVGALLDHQPGHAAVRTWTPKSPGIVAHPPETDPLPAADEPPF